MRVLIGDRAVGDNCAVYVIAEAGSCHGGSLNRAIKLIDAAALAGADAVKFQLFRADTLYPPGPEREAVRPYELPLAWIPELAARCGELGIDFLCTPFDLEAVDLLAPYVPAFKVASYDITNGTLLGALVKHRKPIILSTGASTPLEIYETTANLDSAGVPGVILLHCTATYPAPVEALNLSALTYMRGYFEVNGRNKWRPVGLSDHSRDPILAPVMAVALGACVIEKHFRLPDSTGPDAEFAVDPDDLCRMVEAIRLAERALGSGRKEVLPVEEELRRTARRDPATGLRYGSGA